jgi:capsular polysaccharide transport system permease protein
MIARFILEFITAVIVTVLLLLVLELLGEDCMPVNYSEAACAWCASVFLALGVGFLSAALAILFYFWNMAYTFIILLAYVSSGILFVSSSLPPPVRQALSWNPLLHCIEWMRSAYYVDYNSVVLDKVYLLSFSFLSLVAGLLLERYTRRYKS